jgi:transposase
MPIASASGALNLKWKTNRCISSAFVRGIVNIAGAVRAYMRAPPPVTLSLRERAELVHWSRGRSVPVRRAERARIVLLAADGRNNKEIGKSLHLSPVTVRRWRSRFALLGMAGIAGDAPRSGHKTGAGSPAVATILERTVSTRPTNGFRWTTRTLARALGVSHTTIGRVWRSSGMRPPRYRRWRLSPDPRRLDRHIDVEGIYVDPPGTLLALSIEPLGAATGIPGRFARSPYDLGGSDKEESRTLSNPEQLAEAVGVLDGLPASAASWGLTSREVLLFLESVNKRSPRLSQIHLLTGASSLSQNARVLRWIDRHPRFHFEPPAADLPISQVVREWFPRSGPSRPDPAGLPNLPRLERSLRGFLEGVALLGRPFVWTRGGAVSHWRSTPIDTVSSSTSDSHRISPRTRSATD